MTRWQRFRHWRRTRPFWAGVFLIGSGLVILSPPFATLRLGDLAISVSTLGGASALIIGVMLVVIGASVWIRPQFRVPAGLLALVALAAGTALGGAPAPARATPLAGQAPDQAESCPPPEPDRARARSAATPQLAVRPFRITASRVDLHQVDLVSSNKVVSVRTRQGTKRVLRFVVGAVEITDLSLTTAADGAASLTLGTPAGSSTRAVGPLTLYLEKLCGTLAVGPLGVGFGVPGALLPPISAASPPPLVLPEMTFTNVTIYPAALFAAQLDVPCSRLAI